MDEDTAQQLLQHNEEVKQEADMDRNVFDELSRVDCSEYVEKKNGFSFLSWPFAVEQLRKKAPDAVWEVKRNENGEPFMVTQFGVFVEVAVTVNGITLSQIHPVLDHANKPVTQPSAFNINTSIQRCLVKAIALHGLGLSIYAGEDVPRDVAAERKAAAESPVNQDQAAHIESLIEETNTDKVAFLRYFKADTTADFPANKYRGAIQALEKKRQQKETA